MEQLESHYSLKLQLAIKRPNFSFFLHFLSFQTDPKAPLKINTPKKKNWKGINQIDKAHTLHARMINSKAKPVGIAIHGCQIIDIEINRLSSLLLLLGQHHHSTPHFSTTQYTAFPWRRREGSSFPWLFQGGQVGNIQRQSQKILKFFFF